MQLVHFPYRRCRLMCDADEVDALIAAPTEVKLRELQFPLKAGAVDGSQRLARLNLVWVRRPESSADWDGAQLLNAGRKTIVVGTRNTLRVGVNAVRALGYKADDGAISTRQALSKLKAGRADLALGLQEEVEAASRASRRCIRWWHCPRPSVRANTTPSCATSCQPTSRPAWTPGGMPSAACATRRHSSPNAQFQRRRSSSSNSFMPASIAATKSRACQ